MKLDDIEKLWVDDSQINETDLATEALRIPKLHSKYYRILLDEKRNLYILEQKRLELSTVLEGYYLRTLTNEERIAHGLPEFLDKKILKTDIQKHIDLHPDMIQLNLKIGIQYDKIEFLKDINKMIHGRSFIIKDAISWYQFTNGQG